MPHREQATGNTRGTRIGRALAGGAMIGAIPAMLIAATAFCPIDMKVKTDVARAAWTAVAALAAWLAAGVVAGRVLLRSENRLSPRDARTN